MQDSRELLCVTGIPAPHPGHALLTKISCALWHPRMVLSPLG